MQEWLTYTLSDFLLFSPRTYYRLLERHNAAVWPAQVLTPALGLVLLGLSRRPTRWGGRIASAVLAGLWVWVAWTFLWKRYATINWAARYLAWLFAIEALLLLWTGVVRGRLRFRPSRGVPGIVGSTLYVLVLFLYPLLAPLSGRGWRQAEVFGVLPDPTAIATLGLLLLVEGRPRWDLLAAPVVWCMVSGATLWAMGSPEAWVPPAAAILALLAAEQGAVAVHRARAVPARD